MAEIGDTVKVHYTGKLADGTVFDTSKDCDPLQFTVGSGMVIPGFDQAVSGMKPGDSKIIEIPMYEAYGPYHNELVQEVDRNQVPPGLELNVGQQLQARKEDGQAIILTVVKMSELTVTLDANHPLAGKDLTFDIELVEII